MKHNWTYKKLGEVATFINGYPFKPDDWMSTGLPIIRIQNLNNQDAIFNYYNGEIDSRYFVHNGDVLISWSGTLGVYEWTKDEALLNQHIFKVVFDKGDIDKGFFKYAVSSRIDEMKGKVHGITMQHITKKEFDTTTIPVPPLAEQQRIVSELDLLQGIIDKQQAQLKELDTLTQSIFYDMFGDPVENEKGWEVKTIGELIDKSKYSLKRGPFGGALKKEIFVNDGYLVYEQYHALNNDFSFGRYYISEEKYRQMEEFKVEAGDILISCSGVNLGKLAIVPNNARKGIINQALLKLKLNKNVMTNSMFVFIFSNSNFKKKYFGDFRGCAIPNFPPMTDFKKFNFILPPLSLQQEFAEKIEKIERQKTAISQSIAETRKLFDYTMDKYFG